MKAKVWEQMQGKKYGSLTLLRIVKKGYKYYGEYLCDCGNKTLGDNYQVRTGLKKSCGCLRSKNISKGKKRHGHRPLHEKCTTEYNSWRGMLERCYNPKNISFKNYGGRGIEVCQSWRKSFADFLADMGEKPDKTMSIDRIDVNGNYEPSNCKWSTRLEQSANKR